MANFHSSKHLITMDRLIHSYNLIRYLIHE